MVNAETKSGTAKGARSLFRATRRVQRETSVVWLRKSMASQALLTVMIQVEGSIDLILSVVKPDVTLKQSFVAREFAKIKMIRIEAFAVKTL